MHVEPLVEDVYFPVCSPKLLEPRGGPLRPEDLRRHRLLHVDWPALASTAPSWEMWLRAAHIEHPDADTGHRFTSEMMALDAAIAGVGVALVSSAIADIDIRAGRLVTPFADNAMIRTGFRYHLVLPSDRKPSGDISLFCDWLRTECASRSYVSTAWRGAGQTGQAWMPGRGGGAGIGYRVSGNRLREGLESKERMVGVARFELATPSSRTSFTASNFAENRRF
nr:LysR substrate-binding domain-containing protein [Breoghania sp. L-A4]